MVTSNQQFKFNLPWQCPECKAKGLLGFDDGSDVGLIGMSIEIQHRKKSPNCSCWYSQIKIGWGQSVDTLSNNK